MSILSKILSGRGSFFNLKMPGESHQGELPPLSEEEERLEEELRQHVFKLSREIGERNLNFMENLEAAAEYIRERLTDAGLDCEAQAYRAKAGLYPTKRDIKYSHDEKEYRNLVAEITGDKKPDEIIVVGAHYDSYPLRGCNGANDNASGVAAVLALAKAFARETPARTLRFAAFPNEEPPFFFSSGMGSLVYAKRCRARNENIIAMYTPETLGYYSSERGSQRYPWPVNYFYPDRGDFIAFVGNTRSRPQLEKSIRLFRESAKFPSEGAALPMFIPKIGASDHSSFWRQGYPGIMITDTAPFRCPHYHTRSDDPENLNYAHMARVVNGLRKMLVTLAEEGF